MEQSLIPETVPANTDADRYDRLYQRYRRQHDALILAHQLTQIIRGVQRHRGMSMALLGGNAEFRQAFVALGRELERRLKLVQVVAGNAELLSTKDRTNLETAWSTIRHDWQQDTVIDNYELHSHLIEQLLAILGGLSRTLESPLETTETSAPGHTPFQHLELLHFTLRQMPAIAEQLGRVRALSSYAAARGQCDSHHDGKLRFAIQNTRVNNEKLRHQSKRLEAIVEDDFSQLSQLKAYELKLVYLLTMVEQDVLSGQVRADSSRLFSLTSDIIDFYFSVIERGIDLLSLGTERAMEHWLRGSDAS
ncbi:hypothetical protein [Marinimicrobium alkaliphilum]|uniref:hypothetical protein n=1 Tax=Marinimicrobium alkaliphilum TaxID=2202654 RepID=UPI000DB9A89F|nr:hypothetical protein [Marinimicrobium alkaliphilum]